MWKEPVQNRLILSSCKIENYYGKYLKLWSDEFQKICFTTVKEKLFSYVLLGKC